MYLLSRFLYVDDMTAASIHVMNLDKAIDDANTQNVLLEHSFY
jgi:hypothetical protein